MAKECFCGCGREVPFGRKRATNLVAGQYEEVLELFRGALAKGSDPEHATELAQLADEGTVYRDLLRDVIHGDRDRKEMDKDAMKAWWDRATDHRSRMASEVIDSDYVGWNALRNVDLLHAGARAPGQVIEVGDTGMTINDDPRVKLRIRIEPPGGEPFEVERKVLVSRVNVPRAGERVEVAYDPEDPSEFTFRVGDLTDDAAAAPSDLAEQLARLAELHGAGALTAEEFAAAKSRLLSG